jgi:formamidopyrimidine-DNA glycosylase
VPELPEVEIVLQGLKPHLEGAVIQDVIVRHEQLRWPIPPRLKDYLQQQTIHSLSRRGKYLLIHLPQSTLIVHLGMSGRLCLLTEQTPAARHDHVDIIFFDNQVLRYTDPRRFGAILWTKEDPSQHPLLKSLGVEPLSEAFTAEYFKKQAANRRMPIKSFIMNSRFIVGVGNIYAAEALFQANLHPAMPVGLLTDVQYQRLVVTIQQVLQSAIQQGGTTLKDFVNSKGKPGYFEQYLHVYGRAGLPCTHCQTVLKSMQLGQRSTVFCERCQYFCSA